MEIIASKRALWFGGIRGKERLAAAGIFHLSLETLKAYKLGNTPQTIVISPEGKVLQNWEGAYMGTLKPQIEAFFHVTLPGLRRSAIRKLEKLDFTLD